MSPLEERKSRTESPPRAIVQTAGEVFSDGSAIELVATHSDQKLALLYWKNSRTNLRPSIDIAGVRYVPLNLDTTVRQATRLPHIAAESMDSRLLLSKIAELFETYIGFPPALSPLLSAWVISTWFPELWMRAPDLVITGWDNDAAMVLLRLLSCLVRRPLLLTAVEQNTFRSLPMEFSPTLLINQPSLPLRTLELLRVSNYHDLVVPSTRGRVTRTSGSKAFFLGTNAVETDGLRVALPAAQCRRELYSKTFCERVADEFQPQLLRRRLVSIGKYCAHNSSKVPSLTSDWIRLEDCIYDAADFKSRVAAMTAKRDEEIRADRLRKPEVATVEVLWAPSHNSREIKVRDITNLVNALVRSRGEIFEYGEVEIGLMLRNMGFPRHRNGSGMLLRFSAENCQRLHEVAQEFGLITKKIGNCALCEESSRGPM